MDSQVNMNGSLPFNAYTIMISTFRIGTQYLHFNYFIWFCQEKTILTTSVTGVRPVLQTGDLGHFKDAFLHVRKPAAQTPDETMKPLLPSRCKGRQVAFQRLCRRHRYLQTLQRVLVQVCKILIYVKRARACHATLALLHKRIIKHKYYCSTGLGIVLLPLALVQACKRLISFLSNMQ